LREPLASEPEKPAADCANRFARAGLAAFGAARSAGGGHWPWRPLVAAKKSVRLDTNRVWRRAAVAVGFQARLHRAERFSAPRSSF